MKTKTMTSAIPVALGLALGMTGSAMVAADQHVQTPDSMPQAEDRQTSGAMVGTQRPADDLDDMDLLDRTGETIGEVDAIVQDKSSGKFYAVVEAGGFLGIGESKVVFGLDELQLHEDGLIAPSAGSKQAIGARGTYVEDLYTEVPEDQMVPIATGAAAGAEIAGGGADASPRNPGVGFGTLDVNRDGYLSKDEMGPGRKFADWERADKDGNGLIDRSEFSAFEPIVGE